MVMELVTLGSLDMLLLLFGEFLHTSAKLSMCEQVCSAMAELNAEGVLHRDLAARNVLVASLDPVHVKVCGVVCCEAHVHSRSSCNAYVFDACVHGSLSRCADVCRCVEK
jgi:serine/threonine protein kinase